MKVFFISIFLNFRRLRTGFSVIEIIVIEIFRVHKKLNLKPDNSIVTGHQKLKGSGLYRFNNLDSQLINFKLYG